ncbi:methyltransferase domain-containing protein [Agrobacterium radiobacter]|jgi:predicted TPR repeat methyltransferase|uniref:Class I SAM-dependent methyltransferase n=3 Tax=Agrobacterium tumefaciens complex TaxID=1183400 RepID=A0AAP4YNM7_AGRTU|nr:MULTISPECIES: class I SAM-dependent methyltransferase [Agrobacterium]MCP2134383.1 putative TPR repeat methyltransferase [Rhizobium sp. SLBN-94]TGE80323.1 class I SAM-dependent methyltransferase [Rhizobium sp. SEMIA 439]AYM05780.1 3-demethylubiquinone-9 3-methyltransferase [Agrobacterium tumefaciens]KAA1237221.1 class I SAM-dependent methyltransferase [Agrobacterium tumefaciens]KAB0462091.1 class I SAM-dependent methyltransferase [Agrobacterium tumefaciens]
MTKNQKIDEEALAEAYNRALALEKSGDVDAAVKAYEEVLAIDPDDHGGAAVRIAAMGRGEQPSKAPDAYVETLFDQHAEAFEDILVEQLGYAVPMMVRQRLQTLNLGPFKRLLDLGCGTGLTGEALRDMADDITGIDISENMVEIAHEKDLYETLYVAEAEDFLEDNDDEPFDIITATDVLPYLGALEPLFFGAAENLNAGGLLIFSSETLPEATLAGRPYMVGPHQRFAHAETYVRERLAATGFEVLEVTDINVRMQDGNPTPGHLVIAKLKG